MPSIRTLPLSVVQAIAAGEVVERPAIVVKELIENALDAKATQITIHLENSGLKRITVADNGSGISADQLILALQRHTTSKIQSVDDLSHVTSFGFRGEALASIAAVSKLTLHSRPADSEHGMKVTATNQITTGPEPVGMPPGTTVVVEDLFQNLPVRLKFLKSPATELRHILDVVSRAALSNPAVGFTLTHQRQLLLALPALQDNSERIMAVVGSTWQRHLLPIDQQPLPLKITGFLATPQAAYRTGSKQFLFLNKRAITHPGLLKTIRQAYGSLLSPQQEPNFVLFLEIPPHLVDINVHPRKETVRFVEEAKVQALFLQAISATLESNDLVYRYEVPSPQPLILHDPAVTIIPSAPATAPSLPADSQRTGSATTAGVLRELVKTWENQTTATPILQLENTYLITLDNEGLVLIDQHAAHERILYHQLTLLLSEKLTSTPVQELSPPVVVSLSSSDQHLFSQAQTDLEKVGFRFEEFGIESWQCTQVPALVADRDINNLILELLADWQEESDLTGFFTLTTGLDARTHRTLTFLACRSAVKAGDPLTLDRRRTLVEELATIPNHYTCPHGRPTIIHVGIPELEKWFKRR